MLDHPDRIQVDEIRVVRFDDHVNAAGAGILTTVEPNDVLEGGESTHVIQAGRENELEAKRVSDPLLDFHERRLVGLPDGIVKQEWQCGVGLLAR
ncbi:MAG: hypothetical protein M5T61_15580 [Acidimicrobiia bacterium]|nr:hypothetical protein [Acidimicrobiia bacterium]